MAMVSISVLCPKEARSRNVAPSTNQDKSTSPFCLPAVKSLDEYYEDPLLKLGKNNYKLNANVGFIDGMWTRSLTELDTGATTT